MTSPLHVARWLLSAGAGASARRVLGSTRGAEANDLREASANARLEPGVYALVVRDGEGLVVPMKPSVGAPRVADPVARHACAVALDVVRAHFGVRCPSLRLELEEFVTVEGPSLALPAALAFASHLTARPPKQAVLVTGALDPTGRVHDVGHLEEKLRAARTERGETTIVTPADVRTFAEPLRATLGDNLRVDASVVGIDELLVRARREHDPRRAVELLEAVDARALSPADHARWLLERGTALRHAGRTSEASAAHAEAKEALAAIGRIVGMQEVERYELELWLTSMDEFVLAPAIDALEDRLRAPFLSAHNELRCRGMLAQALAMCHRLDDALAIRERNLALHDASEELASARAGTLVYLALDSARAGRADAFDRWAEELVRATRDEHQWRYSAYALVRGAVALGRFRHAIEWSNGSVALFGARAPIALSHLVRGEASITTHPESSIARALVRALRVNGDATGALRVAARAPLDGGGLEAWLRVLVHVEADLMRRGDAPATAAEALRRAHARATAHHARLCDPDPRVREQELDRVFY